MNNENKNQTRRRFISWGIASAALVAAVNFFRTSPPKTETKTVKMLTQEGKLVEVDITVIPEKKKKITNGELQNWVKK